MTIRTDPIVDEFRRYREEFAARFGYDIDRIVGEAQRLERERHQPAGGRPRRQSRRRQPVDDTSG